MTIETRSNPGLEIFARIGSPRTLLTKQNRKSHAFLGILIHYFVGY